MQNAFQIAGLIGCGIIFQSILSVSMLVNPNWKNIGRCLVFALFAFLPAKHEHGYDLYSHFTMYFVTYIAIFTFYYSKNLLPMLNGYSLIIFNLIFIVTVQTELSQHLIFTEYGQAFKIAAEIFMLPTFVVLLKAIYPFTASDYLKLALYIWYLLMAGVILGITLYHFTTSNPEFFMQDSFLVKVMYFSLGMICLNLGMDLCNILFLIPWPVRDDKNADPLKYQKAQVALLISKFDDETVSLLNTILIIVGVFALFYINHEFVKMDDQLFINLALLASRHIFGTSLSSKIEVSSEVPPSSPSL